MLRRELLARSAGAAVLAVPACTSRRRVAGPDKILVLASRTISVSSLFLAQERGYFRAAGLSVTIEQNGNSAQSLSLVANRKAEAIFSTLSVPVLSAVEKNLPIRIVAAREIASPACGQVGALFAMRKRFPRGLDDLRVLKGKTIGVGQVLGFSQFALDTHLAKAGLSVEDIIPRTLRSPEAIAAVIGGGLDAAVINWDFDKNLERVRGETVRTAGFAKFHPHYQLSHIFFGGTLLDADPGIGGRFLAAYLRGAREFAAGATPDYLRKFAGIQAGDANRLLGGCRDTFTLSGDLDLNSIRLMTTWAFKRKYLSRKLDPSALVDTRFLERAHAS